MSKSQRRVTPSVQACASRLGVDLEAVAGSGATGQITAHDVRMAKMASIDKTLSAARSGSPTAGAVTPRPWVADRNPLVAQAYAAHSPHLMPKTVPPPTLFAAGDTPAFTASGIPAEAVLQVPWQARHALAAAPTQEQAYAIITDCTGSDGDVFAQMQYGGHPGNADYQARVDAWLMAGDPRPANRSMPVKPPSDTMPALTADEQKLARELGFTDWSDGGLR